MECWGVSHFLPPSPVLLVCLASLGVSSSVSFYFCLFRPPGGSVVNNLPAIAGDPGSIPGLGRSPGGENGNSLQYSCLENPMGKLHTTLRLNGNLLTWLPWSRMWHTGTPLHPVGSFVASCGFLRCHERTLLWL